MGLVQVTWANVRTGLQHSCHACMTPCPNKHMCGAGPNELHVTTTLKVGTKSCKYTVVYNRDKNN